MDVIQKLKELDSPKPTDEKAKVIIDISKPTRAPTTLNKFLCLMKRQKSTVLYTIKTNSKMKAPTFRR